MAKERILVHDYAGHPFQAGLSRELARRGHDVTHAYFGGDTGPKGQLQRVTDDPDGISFVSLCSGHTQPSSLVARWTSDRTYGGVLAEYIASWKPSVVLSGNTPIAAQRKARRAANACGARFIFWCQDLHGIAAHRLLSRRLMGLGWLAAKYIDHLERAELMAANAVIAISPEFRSHIQAGGLSQDRIAVISNWSDLSAFARQGGDQDERSRFVVTYTGTLGKKHDLNLLAALAGELETGSLVVHTNESAANELKILAPNADIRPFVRFEDLPAALSDSSVCIALLNEDAADFSVPSKILSYLCAGRPIVISAPQRNLAARIVKDTGAGIVVPPNDPTKLIQAVETLRANPAIASKAARNARRYAERKFNIAAITDRFEEVLFADGLWRTA